MRCRVGAVLAGGLMGGLLLAGCSGTDNSDSADGADRADGSGETGAAKDAVTPASPTGSASPDAEQTDDVTGGWETSYGALTFTVVNGQFTGAYDAEDGTLAGSVDGQEVSGEWYEPDSSFECEEERGGTTYWGTFTFAFAEDGNSFVGTWGYCADEHSGSWEGERRPAGAEVPDVPEGSQDVN